MNITSVVGIFLVACSAVAQTVAGIGTEGLAATHENASARDEMFRQQSTESRLDSKVIVFTGDTVIAHFIDGGYWQTATTVVNLESHPTSFKILFFQDDGTDFYVPVVGVGVVRGLDITLNAAGTLTFETAGTNPFTGSGWASVAQSNSDSVGAFSIFRYSLPGVQQQEAVVPTVNRFSDHFVLPFDNTGRFATGVAIANSGAVPVTVSATIRNEAGQIIDRRSLLLGRFGHQGIVLPSTWISTAGLRGTVEFLTTGVGVGALGIRSNGNSFTSLNVLSNFNWLKF